MAEFYETKAGRQFYDRTMPALVKAVERLADAVAAEKRDPAVAELIEYAGHLADSAERLLDTPIEPGSSATLDSFDLLRANAAAVRRVLAKIR